LFPYFAAFAFAFLIPVSCFFVLQPSVSSSPPLSSTSDSGGGPILRPLHTRDLSS